MFITIPFNQNIPKMSFVIAAILSMTACNTNYQVSTNLDKENFQQYFSAAEVKIYESEKDMPTRRQFIGLVEGQDCQEKPHHAAPDNINARTQARQKAFEQKANGIIFTGCAELTPEQLVQLSQSSDAQQCHAITICYGKAYLVETETK
ncbi:MAG: Rcs stress response system protein RcsF [Colwellia sp.]|nr:Rcs stress response system protein RcsF [Colwellia sp.]MCW8865057.1 Rcs stress response system protein RcsF [Colwellia sp.]MCW9080268.1 Rcs stress response system protein RcsF [Colwellia sp.]